MAAVVAAIADLEHAVHWAHRRRVTRSIVELGAFEIGHHRHLAELWSAPPGARPAARPPCPRASALSHRPWSVRALASRSDGSAGARVAVGDSHPQGGADADSAAAMQAATAAGHAPPASGRRSARSRRQPRGGGVGDALQLVERGDLTRRWRIVAAGGIGHGGGGRSVEFAIDIGVEGRPVRRAHGHRLCPRARASGVTFSFSITARRALRARASRLMTVPSATPSTSAASRIGKADEVDQRDDLPLRGGQPRDGDPHGHDVDDAMVAAPAAFGIVGMSRQSPDRARLRGRTCGSCR